LNKEERQEKEGKRRTKEKKQKMKRKGENTQLDERERKGNQ